MEDNWNWPEPPSPEELAKLPLCRPESLLDATELADRIGRREAFVVALTDIPVENARRILDFLCGAAYLAGAHIQRTTLNTYVITPPEH